MDVQFEVILQDAGKRFQRDRLFDKLNLHFSSPQKIAILGNNGSGKSTLLLAIAGFYALSDGKIIYKLNGKEIEEENNYLHYTLISPALELPEEFTIEEFLNSHFSLTKISPEWDKKRIYTETGLEKAGKRQIKKLSSGMKQRLKLCMAFCSQTPLLLLDEPCTNLDTQGIEWYRNLIEQEKNRLVIIASNMKEEYDFCEVRLRMEELRDFRF